MAVTASALIPAAVVRGILSGFKSEKAKQDAIQIATDRQVQKAVDAMRAGIDKPLDVALKGNAATNPYRREVAEMFERIVNEANLSKACLTNYPTSFFIALKTGMLFERGLFNTYTAEGVLRSEAPTKSGKSGSGKVEKTDRPALFKTLNKALHQMRLLDDHDKAASILDAIKSEYEDFTEVKPE